MAFDCARQGYEIAPYDLRVLDRFISTTLCTGRIHQAYNLIKIWNKLSPHHPFHLADFMENVIKIMRFYDVADEDIAKVQDIVSHLLQERKAYIYKEYYTISSHAGSEWICYGYEIDMPPEDLVELEDAFDERLAELPEKTREAFEVEFIIDDPELEDFLEYADKHMEEQPESVQPIDEDLLDRMDALIGEDE